MAGRGAWVVAFATVLLVLLVVLVPWACEPEPATLSDSQETTTSLGKTVPVENTSNEELPDTGGPLVNMWVGAYNAPHHWYEPVIGTAIGLGVLQLARMRFK